MTYRVSQDRRVAGSIHSTRDLKAWLGAVVDSDDEASADSPETPAGTSSIDLVPLQDGYAVQPQKSLPAFLPRLAVRRAIGRPHFGHSGLVVEDATLGKPLLDH